MNADSSPDRMLGIETPAAPPRPFFTPLSCCLGCAGLLLLAVIAVLGFGYWLWSRTISDTPIAVDMPPITDADIASAREKRAAIAAGELRETAFSDSELNAILRDFLAGELAQAFEVDPALCKGRVELTTDNQIKLVVSLPTDRTGNYLNVEFQGAIAIENGEVSISNVKQVRVGTLDITYKFLEGTFKQVSRDRANQLFGRAQNSLTTFKVENGQLRVAIEPAPQPAVPEK